MREAGEAGRAEPGAVGAGGCWVGGMEGEAAAAQVEEEMVRGKEEGKGSQEGALRRPGQVARDP